MPKEYFDQSDLKKGMRKRVVQGSSFTLVSQFASTFLLFVSTPILARLLDPEDFGLIAMTGAVIGVVLLFQDSGLSMATIQREEISHHQVSNLFWINLGLGFLATAVVAGLAPLIGLLYRDPRLIPITIALSSGIFLGGATVQHQAIMQRQMRFGTLAVISLIEKVGAVASGLGLAVAGAGYWSLVGMQLAKPVIRCAALWSLCPWRPGLPSRRVGTTSLVKFGVNLLAVKILNYFRMNLQKVLLGATWGGSQLGYYDKSSALVLMPIRQLSGPLNSVALPALCRFQDAPDRFRLFFRTITEILAFAIFPCALFLFIDADEVVRCVLGEKWLPAIPIMQLVAPKIIFVMLSIPICWVFVPLGRVACQLKYVAVIQTTIILSFLCGIHWGGVGIAAAEAIAMWLFFIPMTRYAFRGTPVSLRLLFTALKLPAAGSCVASYLLLSWLWLNPTDNVYISFPISAMLFGIIYYLFWLFVPQGRQRIASWIDILKDLGISEKYLHLIKRFLLFGMAPQVDSKQQ